MKPQAIDYINRYIKDLEMLEDLNRRVVSDAATSTSVALAFTRLAIIRDFMRRLNVIADAIRQEEQAE